MKYTEKQIREKVKSGDYTDSEWNSLRLWRYVNYRNTPKPITELDINYIKN